MLSRLSRTLREHSLLPPGTRVLVAVSGGPDSTALLHALKRLAPGLGVELRAATVDHAMRPESGAEAARVVEACAELGVPCRVLRVDVRAARGKHVSWQEAAREARLAALVSWAEQEGCARIALGHTADDQAETVLFRIVRGTGLVGLAGMLYLRGPFVRPLLDTRRAEVLRFLGKRRISFLEDPSNADRRYTRPRVRHDWLPWLEQENPRIVEALLALAAEARQLPTRAVHPACPPGVSMAREAAATVLRLARERAGSRSVAVKGGEVAVSYGRVSFRPRGAARRDIVSFLEAAAPVPIAAPGVYRLAAGPALMIEEEDAGGRSDGALFDPGRLALPLVLRPWRPGERMRPRGGRGTRKLSDLLIDAKVPRDERRALPALVAADDTVLYVPGLRPSEVGRPTLGSRRHWRIHVLP